MPEEVTPINRMEAIMSGEEITPLNRMEAIMSGQDITPITREEYFVKEYAGGHGGGGDSDLVLFAHVGIESSKGGIICGGIWKDALGNWTVAPSFQANADMVYYDLYVPENTTSVTVMLTTPTGVEWFGNHGTVSGNITAHTYNYTITGDGSIDFSD